MVSRRNLFLGSASAAALGALGPASVAAAARSGERAAAAAQAKLAADGFALPFGLYCPVPYLSRAAWGADESLAANHGVYWAEEWSPPQALTVHHTGYAPAPNQADTVRDIFQRQTLQGDGTTGGGQGWGDIGYHLLIDSSGVVYEGRRSGDDAYPVFDSSGYYMSTGAHIYGYNTGNVGVCLIGYFNDSLPTQAAQDSLVTVLAYLVAVTGINPTGTVSYRNPVNGNTHSGLGVTGHLDWAATSCPGNPTFYGTLGSIRQRAAASVPPRPGPTTQAPPTTQPATTQPATTQPTGTTAPPSTGQPTGTGQATQTTAPTQTTVTRPPVNNQPPPPPPPPPGGTPREERGGGDEYVDVAREEQPELFPTVAPTATASPTSAPTATVAASAGALARASQTVPAPVAAGSGGGFGWGVTAATAVGVAFAGAAVGGLVWLRQRRASVAAASGGLTVVDEPTVSTVDSPPPAPDGPAEGDAPPEGDGP